METSNTTDHLKDPPITSDPSIKKKNRRGKGSRAKAAEKFRSHKNETKGAAFIGDRRANNLAEFGITPDFLFGELSTRGHTIQPTLGVAVSTEAVEEVVQTTINTLITSVKVPTTNVNFDIETLMCATSLQVFAKFHYAQAGTPFCAVSAEREVLAKRVVDNIPQNIITVAALVEQLGRFELEDQNFVPIDQWENSASWHNIVRPGNVVYERFMRHIVAPYYDMDDNPVTGQTLQLRNVVGPHGYLMYVVIHDIDRALALNYVAMANDDVVLSDTLPQVLDPAVAQYIELRTQVKIDVDSIFQRFHELISRIQKKLPYEKIVDLNLAKGLGTPSQLCCLGEWEHDLRTVWSARRLPYTDLFMGAAFRFGAVSQPLALSEVAHVRALVDVRSAIPRMMCSLTARLERR